MRQHLIGGERGHFFFVLLGRCVRADPAAVLAVLLALGSRRILEAADAARLLVTSPLVPLVTLLLPFGAIAAPFG